MRRALLVGALTTLVAVIPLCGQSVDVGIRAYTERGDAREAIRLLAPHAESRTGSLEERVAVAIYLGHAFLALGDTVSALPHIHRALGFAPCVRPADDVPPAWRAHYDKHRPVDASCGRRALSATFKSIFIPGWGQRSLDASGTANAFLVFTVLAVGGAAFTWVESHQLYDEYKSTTDWWRVGELYDEAEEYRQYALGLAGAAAVFHVWNMLDAMRRGIAHDRELARYQNFAVGPSAAPGPHGLRIGLQLSF